MVGYRGCHYPAGPNHGRSRLALGPRRRTLWPEQRESTVNRPISLHSLKNFLGIMKDGAGRVEDERFARSYLSVMPALAHARARRRRMAAGAARLLLAAARGRHGSEDVIRVKSHDFR